MGSRGAARARRPRTPQAKLHAIEGRFNDHFFTAQEAHFPSPAYGEARDGALVTAPRGGNGGGAFSPFSVVVAVGPSRGGRSGGHKRQLGWDASQDSRRMLLAESVTDEAASRVLPANSLESSVNRPA